MTVSSVVGGVSGGALGFLAGNVGGAIPGAYVGYKVANSIGKRKSESWVQGGTTKRRITGSAPGRPAVVAGSRAHKTLLTKMTARRAVRRVRKAKMSKKAKAKRTRKVKKAAGKFVKSVVDRALSCDLTTSVYRKLTTGEIVMDMRAQDAVLGYQLMFSGNTQQGIATKGATARAAKVQMWTYFTAKKMLDAASVLFNNKARDADYYVTTDNIAFNNLKLEVMYQSVKWEALNDSYYHIRYELYEFHARANTNVSAGHELVASAGTGVDISSSNGPVTQGFADNHDSSDTVVPFRYSLPLLNKLSDFKGYDGKWTHKLVKKGTMLPGTKITHYMHQKPGCVEFKKYMDGTDLTDYSRGTVCLILIVKPMLNHTVVATPASGLIKTAGSMAFNGLGKTTYGVVVSAKESYTIREPDEATVRDSKILGLQDIGLSGSGYTDLIMSTRTDHQEAL